jgi:transposase-like protein
VEETEEALMEVPSQRAYNRLRKYGVTQDEFDQKLKDQNYRCAICQDKLDNLERDPGQDHDHKTGTARGILCIRCNAGLGMFKDSIRILASAIVYLQDHGKEFNEELSF